MRYNVVMLHLSNDAIAAKGLAMTPSIGPERPSDQPVIPPKAEARDERGAELLKEALIGTVNTRNTYIVRWRSFTDWCDSTGLNPLPASPDTVIRYLETLASSTSGSASIPSFATLRLAASVITKVHELGEYRSPCKDRSIKGTLKRLEFKLAKPRAEVGALTYENCYEISVYADDRRRRGRGEETEAHADRRGRVDVALVYALSEAGLSAAEASQLTWGGVQRWEHGSGRITVPGSMTGVCTQGAVVAITGETMEALDAIRPSDAASDAKVFGLSASQIVRRVKAAAKAASIKNWRAFNGRSGRLGLDMRLAEGKAPEHVVERQARKMQRDGRVGRYTSGECAAEAVEYL